METGTPYMLYKAGHNMWHPFGLVSIRCWVPQDAANRKSNQQNLGTIHCSNLCTEIIEYTSPDEEPLLEVGDVADVGFEPFNKLPLDFPPDHSQQDSCPPELPK